MNATVDHDTPTLKQGDRIAWVMKNPKGVTTGVSRWHRVFEHGMTYCATVLPGTDAILPGNLSLPSCSRCERLHERAKQYIRGDAK